MIDNNEIADIARQVKGYLDYFSSLGVRELPRVDVDVKAPPRPVIPLGNETLEQIRADLGDCRRCRLSGERTHIVFGEGPEDARLMFVGEGPGGEEDKAGRPFIGPAGRMLTDIIVKGMKMKRENCYIANIVKCRPPRNRDPKPNESATCLPFLRRQIAVIRPKVIVALGRIAAQNLLNTDTGLLRLRHRFHDLDGIPVMPTFHPSALLRDPARKRDTWEDIKLVIARLDEPD